MNLSKNHLILVIFILLNFCKTHYSIAQCPDRPGKPVLRNQAAVDSFLAIYPNCDNYIEGYMAIDGKPIYWVYEDVRGYLLTLFGLLVGILIGLKLVFRQVEWFQK